MLMNLKLIILPGAFALAVACSGCSSDPSSAATNGPSIENPAAALPDSIIPGVGTAGNGGGVSGGGAGAAVSHD